MPVSTTAAAAHGHATQAASTFSIRGLIAWNAMLLHDEERLGQGHHFAFQLVRTDY